MKKKLTLKEFTLLISLYTSQYIGFAFFAEAFIGILRQNNMPLENLGLIYMLGLFWVFRFLWAPFIDRIKFKIGHYKGWIIIFQLLMVIVLLTIGQFSLIDDLQTIVLLSVLFAFVCASQSIALDGLVYKNVFKRERSFAMSIKTASGLLGMVLGGGVGLVLYTHLGWETTLIIVSLIMLLALIQVIFYKESKPKTEQSAVELDYKQFISFWKGKNKKVWMLLLFLYPASISAAYGLITPILVDLGWSLDRIGYAVHIVGYSIGVLASFSTSWFIKKYGKKNVLIGASLGQSLGTLLLLLLFYNNDILSTIVIVGIIFSFYTPSMVIMTTLMMDKASKKTPAAQFAAQHSIYMFSGIIFATLAVSFAGVLGYTNIVFIGAFVGLLAAYTSYKIELEEEKGKL
ncbi:MAG: MFS transporter [Campylobacterales bacterium]|nr:MFS transporter [Campylobacterales bacterium]